MARTDVRWEGGTEAAPQTIVLSNERLVATLRREGETYLLTGLSAGGEQELLGGASPLLFCFDGKEHLPIALGRVAIEQEESVARVRFAAEQGALAVEAVLSLTAGRPFLDLLCTFRASQPWQGLIYASCLARKSFVPSAYPWIAGEHLTDGGYAYANCMGAPLLHGDPRGDGHTFGLGFPLGENYRDLIFHYDLETQRVSAGLGEGISRPGLPAPPAPEPPKRSGILRRKPAAEAPPSHRPLDLRVSYRPGESYCLPVQIWALTGEHRNLAGEWVKGNGFSFLGNGPRTIEESLRLTLGFLRDGAPFVDGKGYPMRARRYTHGSGEGDGAALHVYGNAALACALYRCWVRFREEWMRERALAMVDFVLSAQERTGLFHELYDPGTRRWRSIGTGFHYDGAGFCLDALLRLQQERRDAENTDDVRLRRAVVACVMEFLDERRLRMERERKRGLRRHDQETTFPFSAADDRESANVNLLIVLERLRRTESDRRFEIVREDGEKWLLHNVLHQMSWRGGDPTRPGLGSHSILRCLEYAMLRQDATQGKRYLDMAETLASHYFLTLVPKDLEWCAGRTKGLALANADWRALSPAFAGCVSPIAALHRLGKLCNDRFYANLGDHLVRAAMAAQCDEKGVPGCGGWMRAVNSPDANAFVLNGVPFDGELCVTDIVPGVLETYLSLLK